VQGLDGLHVQLDGDVRRSLRVHLTTMTVAMRMQEGEKNEKEER